MFKLFEMFFFISAFLIGSLCTGIATQLPQGILRVSFFGGAGGSFFLKTHTQRRERSERILVIQSIDFIWTNINNYFLMERLFTIDSLTT